VFDYRKFGISRRLARVYDTADTRPQRTENGDAIQVVAVSRMKAAENEVEMSDFVWVGANRFCHGHFGLVMDDSKRHIDGIVWETQ
jgi:hypothetical protein